MPIPFSGRLECSAFVRRLLDIVQAVYFQWSYREDMLRCMRPCESCIARLKELTLSRPFWKGSSLVSSSCLLFDFVNNGWSRRIFSHFGICRLFWGVLFCSWCCRLIHFFGIFIWPNLTLRWLWDWLLLLVLKTNKQSGFTAWHVQYTEYLSLIERTLLLNTVIT